MAHIITGKDELLAAWAAKQIPYVGSGENFGPCRAIGVATGPEPGDRLLAVIVYHDFHEDYGHCQISGAAADPRWASRATLRGVLAIPFYQFSCNLVWTATPHTAERVIRFNQAIGFTREAVLRDRFGKGNHAVICRMTAKDYDRHYWQESRKAA